MRVNINSIYLDEHAIYFLSHSENLGFLFIRFFYVKCYTSIKVAVTSTLFGL